MFNKL